jgi:hypothetical protein
MKMGAGVTESELLEVPFNKDNPWKCYLFDLLKIGDNYTVK